VNKEKTEEVPPE